ncbi:MAG: NAD(P)-dependent oxidoreductase [Gammaproteobacteria bacterium]|nr:MAG: NAD(P)-dependent oxidoreductase [Gammaproteobacteria bacterium]
MKILVTGGTGFLGRHIVWRLAELGHDIVFTGRDAQAAAQVSELARTPASWLALNHGHAESALVQAARGMDAIVHSAALSSPWGKYADFYEANVTGTEEVLSACIVNQIPRLIHISTPSLYFDFKDRLNINEQEPLPPPVNDYASTKGQAEQRVLSSKVPERVILRPRAIFGPWDNTLMPRILRVMKNGSIPLMRGGQALLDITYVENVVEAVVLALTKPISGNVKTYNVTNGEPQTLHSLLQQMASAFELPLRTRPLPWWLVSALAQTLEFTARKTHGREPKITRYGAGVLAFSQTLDISAIQEDLGYRPQLSIAEGMRRHALWYANQNTISNSRSAS